MCSPGRFLYFGFGSNLLSERLRLANKSAEFLAIGRLAGYRLDFADPHHSMSRPGKERTWHGGAATLVEDADAGQAVIGAVWSLADEDADSLDRQEGVKSGIYKRIDVTVELLDSKRSGVVRCRSYQMVQFQPLAPSPYYLDVILRGAVQSGLPNDYVDALRRREHNNYTGECKKYQEVLEHCAASPEGVPPCQIEVLRKLVL